MYAYALRIRYRPIAIENPKSITREPSVRLLCIPTNTSVSVYINTYFSWIFWGLVISMLILSGPGKAFKPLNSSKYTKGVPRNTWSMSDLPILGILGISKLLFAILGTYIDRFQSTLNCSRVQALANKRRFCNRFHANSRGGWIVIPGLLRKEMQARFWASPVVSANATFWVLLFLEKLYLI